MPVLIAPGEDDKAKLAAKSANAGGELSPDELAMCASLGLTQEAFKAAKAA